MKTIRVQDAVGMVLGQDLTRVVPDEFKGVAFKKGHVVQEKDIPMLLSMGKDHVFIIETEPGDIHENDAAAMVAQVIMGTGGKLTEAAEGKVSMKACYTGLLKVNQRVLAKINRLEGIAVSTLHSDTIVREGQLVASAKIIPLVIPGAAIEKIQTLAKAQAIIKIKPFARRSVGIVITGNEVYYGRIQDRFESILKEKLRNYPVDLSQTIFTPDDPDQIAAAVQTLAAKSDVVIACGGMSVDPDDVTPEGIRRANARIIAYGTPVLPGAMFLVAYLGKKTVLGLPACGMFSKTTILDTVLPKVMAGERITRSFIAELGHGGLCRQCEGGCRYPDCSFCK